MKFLKPLDPRRARRRARPRSGPTASRRRGRPWASPRLALERRDIRETVEAAGFVRAVTFSTIRAAGQRPDPECLNVQTGDMVKKDQILVELDPVLANADEEQAAPVAPACRSSRWSGSSATSAASRCS
jgi:hypothetical protein